MIPIAAFALMVAPRPSIVVFVDAPDYWACMERDEATGKIYLGWSQRLAHEVDNFLQENFGPDHRLEKRAEVTYAHGHSYRVEVPKQPSIVSYVGQVAIDYLLLNPVPVDVSRS